MKKYRKNAIFPYSYKNVGISSAITLQTLNCIMQVSIRLVTFLIYIYIYKLQFGIEKNNNKFKLNLN